MTHNLPRWLIELLSNTFSEKEMQIIDRYWYTYNQISLTNSSQEQLVAAARSILKISSLCHGLLDV